MINVFKNKPVWGTSLLTNREIISNFFQMPGLKCFREHVSLQPKKLKAESLFLFSIAVYNYLNYNESRNRRIAKRRQIDFI